MTKPPTHPDEHMTHVEWSGALTAIPLRLTAGKRRRHAWQASSGILALLASLLILNGCDRQETSPTPPEGAGATATPSGGGEPPPDAVPAVPEAPAEAPPPAGTPGEGSAPKP
ncbi:MAG: hypothetical protein AB1482_00855 [Pseudomonadota bacterium]